MTSFYCRRLPQALILVLFECLNGTGPTYIGSLFKYRHTPYRLRGESLNMEPPNFSLKLKKNSFTFSLAKLWNSLPPQVRLSRDANDFRSKLHDCSFLERLSYNARLQPFTVFRTCITVFHSRFQYMAIQQVLAFYILLLLLSFLYIY